MLSPRNPSSPMRGKTQSSKVFSSHSSAWGWSSLTTNAWIDSRSRSCSSVKMKCGRLAAWSGLRIGSAAGMDLTLTLALDQLQHRGGREPLRSGLMLIVALTAPESASPPFDEAVAELAAHQHG